MKTLRYGLSALIAAAALSLYALKGTAIYFYTPAQMIDAKVKVGEVVRLGGLVKTGSVTKLADGSVRFTVMDKLKEINVAYKGDLPDLFREGQGVVAEGALDASGVFKADTVLAKHDETYMPKDVADSLKKQGHWKDDYGAKQGVQAQRTSQGTSK